MSTKLKPALTHGIYSNELLLPWESKEEFDTLLAALINDLSPEGPLQMERVVEIARLYHLKNRIRQSYQAKLARSSLTARAAEATQQGPEAVEKLIGQQMSSPQTISMTSQDMFARIKDQISRKKADQESEQEQPSTSESQPTSKPDIEDFFERLYDLDGLERMLKREANVDAKIDKALGRYAILKECKRRYGAPTSLPPH